MEFVEGNASAKAARTKAKPKQQVTCVVCCEDVAVDALRACGFCQQSACISCHKQWQANSNQDASCIHCLRAWDQEVMDTIFTKSYVQTEYRQMRTELVYQREKAMFPDTMQYIAAYKQAQKMREEINHRHKANTELQAQPALFLDYADADEYMANALIMADREGQAAHYNVAKDYLWKSVHNLETWAQGKTPVGNSSGKWFNHSCPVDDCRGFLSKAWRCGLCETHVCPKCLCVRGKSTVDEEDPAHFRNHVCNAQAVETADLLRKDSKNCPKCGTVIFKIDGCDQMFCTAVPKGASTPCHTAFSWNTGAIAEGKIHNPHYYEYMRQRSSEGAGVDAATGARLIQREQGDFACGGMPSSHALETHLCKLRGLTRYNSNVAGHRGFTTTPGSRDWTADEHIILKCARFHGHVVAAVLPNELRELNNLTTRIAHLRGDTTVEEFKRLVYLQDRRNRMLAEKRRIMQMFAVVVADIFVRFMAGPDSLTSRIEGVFEKWTHTDPEYCAAAASELFALVEYVNNTMRKIAQRYSTCPTIIMTSQRMPATHNPAARDVLGTDIGWTFNRFNPNPPTAAALPKPEALDILFNEYDKETYPYHKRQIAQKINNILDIVTRTNTIIAEEASADTSKNDNASKNDETSKNDEPSKNDKSKKKRARTLDDSDSDDEQKEMDDDTTKEKKPRKRTKGYLDKLAALTIKADEIRAKLAAEAKAKK